MGNVEFKEEIVKEVEILDPYGFIYITTNMINGKKYIGQSTFNKNKKWKVYLGSGKILAQAINKYGKENFNKEIVAITYSQEDSNKLEIEFIENHNAVQSHDYYNIALGGYSGSTGLVCSEETRIKRSVALIGRPRSKETKQKISKTEKGKIVSNETKRKLSESHKGKKHSVEAKQKISIVTKGENNPNFGNIKIKFTKEELSEIRDKYSSGNYRQYELAEEYLIDQSEISRIINFRGRYKK